MATITRTLLRPLSTAYRSRWSCTRHQRPSTPLRPFQTVPPTAPFTVSARLKTKKYTEDHEWVEVSPDGKTGTIGISTYAATQLGDVVYVELPQIDIEINAGDSIGAVESVKSASDIMAPVSGKVVATNEKLNDKPSLINQSPENDAWIAKVEMTKPEEWEGLMEGEDYAKLTEGEK
ncbi:MAG: glycine cleavage system H-protein subunit [Watsoniomyces obsoletus]|nr:MAG: glycine cleavage system H-protein subunit [Watsoniomyces obsoletus]